MVKPNNMPVDIHYTKIILMKLTFCHALLLRRKLLRKKKESRFYVIFPAFRRLRHADSMYVYHYTLAFEPDFTGAT